MLGLKTNSAYKSEVPEDFITLRINLEFSKGERKPKTIAVTSCIRGEGRTISAFHLASAYAQAGKKTLLIDADLRNPGIHHLLRDANQAGLTSCLSGLKTAQEVILHAGKDNLSVMTTGPLTSNSTDLLASDRMGRLLEDLKGQYDMILVDSPPVTGHIDAKVLAATCDGVLLVIEQAKVKRAVAKRAQEELMRVKAELLGVVMNKTKPNSV